MNDLIQTSFTEKITERIDYHRNRFNRIIKSRYMEFLPLTIGYENTDNVNIDQIKLEYILRCGYGACVGEDNKGKICLLGYIKNTTYNRLYFNYLDRNKIYTTKDIYFTIPKRKRNKQYLELRPETKSLGNFVVLWNKPLNYNNDYEIIEHYCSELTEIIVSRYSIIMQAKINTFLRDEFGSDDMENIASALYNGKPWIKTSTKFDVEEHIVNISNVAFVSCLAELKRTYQNILAELNSMLGLNSLGVDKESGVSQTEANSNRSFKKANENIYLRSRNSSLELLNKKYGLEIHAEYVDSMVKELSSLEKVEVIANE